MLQYFISISVSLFPCLLQLYIKPISAPRHKGHFYTPYISLPLVSEKISFCRRILSESEDNAACLLWLQRIKLPLCDEKKSAYDWTAKANDRLLESTT